MPQNPTCNSHQKMGAFSLETELANILFYLPNLGFYNNFQETAINPGIKKESRASQSKN